MAVVGNGVDRVGVVTSVGVMAGVLFRDGKGGFGPMGGGARGWCTDVLNAFIKSVVVSARVVDFACTAAACTCVMWLTWPLQASITCTVGLCVVNSVLLIEIVKGSSKVWTPAPGRWSSR